MLNDSRAIYGDRFVIQAVPALAMIIGTLAWVTTGASAMADGENTKPASILTLSLVINSVAAVLAAAPVGGPSSRLTSSTVFGAMSLACNFTYRSNALSTWWPRSALAPLNGSTTPILIFSAWAVPPTVTAKAVSPNHFANFIESSREH